MIFVHARRHRLAIPIAVLILLIIGLSYRGVAIPDQSSWSKWTSPSPAPSPGGAPPPSPPAATPELPKDYLQEEPDSDWCEERYGLKYLENARDSADSYCKPGSSSSFHCFWSSTADNRNDAMCYGRGAVYDAEKRRWRLNCDWKTPSEEELEKGAHDVPKDLTRYWYNTGPGHVMHYVKEDRPKGVVDTKGRKTILLKREGAGNVWHCLMEIIALAYTVDILQISVDPDTKEPFLTAKDGENAQVVVLDDQPDGPFFDLWKLFAKLPIRRIGNLTEDEPPTDIILPFAGGSNTLWQGDWTPHGCRDSPLVKTFARRALALYGVKRQTRGDDVVVTFVKRTGTRSLHNETELLEAARAVIPNMKLNEVDFATMKFKEQLEVVQKTDLLAGVHGAGLTHTMFLPRGSATLEILPDDFFHKGFRNLAQIMGNGYFSTHGKVPGGADSDWQNNAVEIEEDKFVEALREAVRSLYNNGMRSHDAV
ncbi:hypothetical protein CEP54_003998 [Fusarium duplospermum]|uniref:EGF domain-specific O-linked N-acetylglucosamine transferase n=1 Tax=Fusarium duplospermum TaxID=1325734 RepID=A0A428QKN4_9HYPO|nr:hypothetical protein CEP54_003998 [Fusarium duplospermum]